MSGFHEDIDYALAAYAVHDRAAGQQAEHSLKSMLPGYTGLPPHLRRWQSSCLTGDGFPVEFAFSASDQSLRYTVDVMPERFGAGSRLEEGVNFLQRLDGQRLSLYRFQHNLFQTYLYSELDEVERVCLHEDVGNVLEELYGDQADEIAVQLARHFEEAGVEKKARYYLRRAGEQAAARFANDEALAYFDQALELTEADQMEERYSLLMAREKIWSLKGDRKAQAQDLTVLEALAEALDNDQRRAEVALRRGSYAGVTGDYLAALTAAQTAVRLSQATQDSRSEAAGRLQWGRALVY